MEYNILFVFYLSISSTANKMDIFAYCSLERTLKNKKSFNVHVDS